MMTVVVMEVVVEEVVMEMVMVEMREAFLAGANHIGTYMLYYYTGGKVGLI